jgi:predicted transcriptional regulator
MAKVMTPTEIAEEFGTTGREVRKFLRSITPKDSQPGKGSRWSIDANATQLKKLRKLFEEWAAAKAEKVAEDATDEVAGDEELEDAELDA